MNQETGHVVFIGRPDCLYANLVEFIEDGAEFAGGVIDYSIPPVVATEGKIGAVDLKEHGVTALTFTMHRPA